MPTLFGNLSHSADPSSISSSHTSPKRRMGFLGRSSFFSRSTSGSSSSGTSIALEPTTSAFRGAPPTLPPLSTSPGIPLSAVKSLGTPGAIAKFLSSTSPPCDTGHPDGPGGNAALLVSLLPSALSNTSIGPSSALQPSASDHLGGISASTSRNTVLPASHPILNSSASTGSTFLPPSSSLGPNGRTGGAFPTLASAIKLPSPVGPTGDGAEGVPGDGRGGGSILFRRPVILPISKPDSLREAEETACAPAPAAPVPAQMMPRSTSNTSIFGTSRIRRIASRASIVLGEADRKASRKVSAPVAGADVPGGGETLGRRLSRRLSIDNIRPLFPGNTAKRRSVIVRDRQLDIQQWVKGASSAGASLPLAAAVPTQAEQPTADKKTKGKERLALPGIRSWRSKFSSKPSNGGHGSGLGSDAGGSASGSVRGSVRSRNKRDSWVDVESVLEVGTGPGVAGSAEHGQPTGSGARDLLAALRWEEPSNSAAHSYGQSAHPTAHPNASNSMNAGPSPRQTVLLATLLARPSGEIQPAAADQPSGLTTSTSIASLSAPGDDGAYLLSPAADDRSLLEPARSPLPTPIHAGIEGISFSISPASVMAPNTIRAEPVRDEEQSFPAEDNAPPALAPAPSTSERSLQAADSAFSFHTARSRPASPGLFKPSAPPRLWGRLAYETDPIAATLPRSRSRPNVDGYIESDSTLIERTEREQGEGWWSVAAPRAQNWRSRSYFDTDVGFTPAARRRAAAAAARASMSAASPLWSTVETRRQSSPALLSERRRTISALTRSSPAASVRQNAHRPSRLSMSYKDQDDQRDNDETPTSRARRRTMDAARAAVREPPAGSRAVRPRPTAASLASASPGSISGLSERSTASMHHPLDLRAAYYEELERLKDKHSFELESLADAFHALETENAALRVKSRQSALRAREEWEKRQHEKERVASLERVMKRLRGEQLELKPEEELWGPELMSLKFGAEALGVPKIRLYEDAYSTADLMKSPRRRHSRGISASRDADEFGRLGGPSAAVNA